MENEMTSRITPVIGRDESVAIKGLLIMIIVLGHNHILAPSGSTLFSYLYSFHLMCFFILPWFYFSKHKTISSDQISSIIRRNYIPYSVFFLICLFLFVVVKEQPFNIDWRETAFGYFIGSPLHLRKSVGFIFLWFLPSFASFSILKAFCNTSVFLKYLLLTVSLCTIFLPWDVQELLKNNLPFGLFFAIKFLCLGWISVKCMTYIPQAQYVGGFFFMVITILYFIGIRNGLMMQLFPVFAFLAMLSLRKIVCNLVLCNVGKYSLCIYLTHMFISTLLDKIFPTTMVYGILAYCITLVSSYLCALFIYKIKLNKIIFPR